MEIEKMNTERFLFAFVLLVIGADLVLAASAPMRVASGGLTVEEQLAAQAELSNTLLNNLPSTAMAIQIPFTAEEAATIEASKKTLPLKIGVVKAVTPRVKIRGKDLAGLLSSE